MPRSLLLVEVVLEGCSKMQARTNVAEHNSLLEDFRGWKKGAIIDKKKSSKHTRTGFQTRNCIDPVNQGIGLTGAQVELGDGAHVPRARHGTGPA